MDLSPQTKGDRKAVTKNRQATGPPRSGAGVGVGRLRGAGDSLTCFFLDFEDYQDSTIVKFSFRWKSLGEDDCCGTKKKTQLFKSIV